MTETSEPPLWPPQYTIKKHTRARHVKIKVSLKDGLEIVTPVRFNQKEIPNILEENKAWIKKKLAEIVISQASMNESTLPQTIVLNAINQTWHVQYIKSNNKKLQLITRPEQEVVIFGDIENKTLCLKLLCTWVKNQAHIHLIPWLHRISQQMQLTYKNITIRGQRGRWGSCTHAKNISLNYKLLFMPKELVDHILIHELCHTAHLNHSTKFWRLVASFDPLWKEHNKQIRLAEKKIPAWVQ